MLNGQVAGIGWLLEPTQIPTITGNTFGDNTTPFILRGSDNNAANLPTAAQIQDILDTNGDANTQLCLRGRLDHRRPRHRASRNDGAGPYHSFAVTNTIDTLNLALDTTARQRCSASQRDYIHAGDTIIVQSGATGTVNSQIMVEDLTVKATANSADLNLTLATNFANGSAIAGGGVHNITLRTMRRAWARTSMSPATRSPTSSSAIPVTTSSQAVGAAIPFTGGAGNDIFFFDLASFSDGTSDTDIIIDYKPGEDIIDLNGTTFGLINETSVNRQVGLVINIGDHDFIFVVGAESISDITFIV